MAITPSTTVRSVFDIPNTKTYSCIGTKDTLSTALNYGGGSDLCSAVKNLLRAATAALLNEAYYGSKYPAYSSTQELISAVNQAIASGDRATIIALQTQLDAWNNGDHSAV